jgi:uncharacterized protein
MAASPFLVGVAKLRHQAGAVFPCSVEGELDPQGELAPLWPGESEVPAGAWASFTGSLESIPGGLVVSGVVRCPWRGQCRRCACEVVGEVVSSVRERYLEGADQADEEAYGFEGDLVDLGPMIREAVVLELPLAPLCREDCRGLCVQCGQDLNEALCACEAPVDPRWASLEALRQPDEP